MASPIIAYISSSEIPGKTANVIQVMKMVEAFMESGHKIVLTAIGNDENIDHVHLKRLYGVNNIPDKFFLFPTKGRFGIYTYAIKAIICVRRHNVDMVYTRSIVIATLSTLFGLSTFLECHAPPQRVEKIFWRILINLSKFKRLIFISEALHKIMLKYIPKDKQFKIIIAHDGVDLKRYVNLPNSTTAKSRAGIPADKMVVGYSGHLYSGRGVDIILNCAEYFSDWFFVIAGGNKKDIEIAKIEAERRSLGNIEFIGFINNATLAEKLSICDILLMPYQYNVMVSGNRLNTARWMSPLKMFEYMAMKRAIVSSDLPVLREILDEKSALLVKADDPKKWIEALQKLKNKPLRIELAQNAFQKVASYDWQTRTRRILDNL